MHFGKDAHLVITPHLKEIFTNKNKENASFPLNCCRLFLTQKEMR